jgi:hypothetical protein
MFLLRLIWAVVHALFTKRADLVPENLALRQQLIVLHRKTRRPRLKTKDRAFWLWLARSWDGWRESLIVVKPATVESHVLDLSPARHQLDIEEA